ncbi:MAG: YdcF family protein [Micropruina glycogenica]
MNRVGRAVVGRACRDLTAAFVATWLLAEAAHALASVPDHPSSRRTHLVIPANAGILLAHDTLLVLGCPSRRDGRPSAAQRWRIDLAARNARATTRFVISGAGEAEVMARDLTDRHGILPSRITTETAATNTWQNVGNCAELIEPGGVVRMVSDPLHARRAERYWRLQHPERADELRPAMLYRFGEHPLLKVATAGYEVLLRSLRYRPAP